MSGPQNLGIPKDFRPKMGPQNQLMINVDRHGLGMSWGCYDECGSQKVVAFFFAHPWLQLWGREGFVSYISSFCHYSPEPGSQCHVLRQRSSFSMRMFPPRAVKFSGHPLLAGHVMLNAVMI